MNPRCPQCDAPLPQGLSIEGMCPACLFQSSRELESSAGVRSHQQLAVSEVQSKLDPIEVNALIGVGAMGAIYLGRDPALDVPVAIKMLAVTDVANPVWLERLRREGDMLARLDHPGIARLYRADLDHALPHLIMEWIEGPTLASYLAGNSPSEAEAQGWLEQILEALQHAHDRGIIHRDLKPGNLMLDPDQQIRLVDFGISVVHDLPSPERLTSRHRLVGTPQYMAPEIFHGSEVSAATDLYAAGVLAHQMLTGEIPAPKGRPSKALHRVSPALRSVVQRALAPDPVDRFASATEFLDALRAKSAPPPKNPRRFWLRG